MLGRSPAVISNEVNPEVTSHKQSLEDSIPVQLLTVDFRILHAYSHALHHVALQLPALPEVSDVELLNQFARWQALMGETCEHIRQALEDNRVEPRELREVSKAGHRHMTAFLAFLSRLEQLVEE